MGGLLVLIGVVGLGWALVNVARPTGRLQMTTRKRGAAMLGASLVVMSIGIASSPSVADPVVSAPTSTTEATTTSLVSTTSSTTTTTAPTTTTSSLPDVPDADVLFAGPSLGPSGDPAGSPPNGSVFMTVTGITDGDTIEVRFGSATDTIRLIGVNTPESGECFASEAALVLSSLIPVGTEIATTVDVSDRDQFDRLLRYLWVGAMSVNEELVRRGAAISRRYPPDVALAPRFEQAQDEARDAGLGLWESDACGPDAGSQITVMAVNADAPGDDNDQLNEELVRLRNNGSLAVDMTGWVLKDESASHRYVFPVGFVVAAGDSVNIHTGCGTDSAAALYWCNDGAVWNNDGDTAFILDHNGNIVHTLAYVPPTTTTIAPTTTAAPAPEPSSECHPSYTGECVPITSDVDCRGGSGNGPEYVGRVTVVGPDEYGLDNDNDGIGCEDS